MGPKAFIVGLALSATGCAGPHRPDPPAILSKVDLTAAQIAAVEAKAKEKLKDPYSAVFGKRLAGKNEHGTTIVCGLVNAKNGFGGYTGMGPYQAFIASTGAVEVAQIDSSPQAAELTFKACADQGLPIRS